MGFSFHWMGCWRVSCMLTHHKLVYKNKWISVEAFLPSPIRTITKGKGDQSIRRRGDEPRGYQTRGDLPTPESGRQLISSPLPQTHGKSVIPLHTFNWNIFFLVELLWFTRAFKLFPEFFCSCWVAVTDFIFSQSIETFCFYCDLPLVIGWLLYVIIVDFFFPS